MREAFVRTVTTLLDEDPRVAVVLAAISADALAPARRRHPDRVIDVGIREQLMIGVAGGLALTGMRPIAHSYVPFLLERGYEQVKLDLGHQGVDAVLASIGASYDWAEGGQTHRGAADVALLDTLDGWQVHVPGHADEVEPLLRVAVRGPGRHYLRLSTASNAHPRRLLDGRLDVVRTGSRGLAVLAVGPTLDPVLAGTADLPVTVLYATTVRPLDVEGVRTALDAAGRSGSPRVGNDLIVVEPYLAGTSSPVLERALAGTGHRVTSLGVGRLEVRRYGSAAEHDAVHGLDAAGIRRAVESVLC